MSTKILASLVYFTMTLIPNAAVAQGVDADATSTVKADEGAGLGSPGDIIVTARKRQESILKVPVVENVVSGAQIEKSAITNFADLSARIPGLSLGAAVLSIGPQISLRGVGTSTLDAGVDQSVSLNLDGLALSQGLAYSAGVFDLAQAEVLKGPQALFFGKNSPGGVISLRTADPGSELEVIARASYEFEARQKRIELIVSSPLSDTFGIRLAGTGSMADGFFHNTAFVPAGLGLGSLTPKYDRTDHAHSYILRGTAVWKPTAAFDARLKVNLTRDKVDGNASENQLTSCPEGTGPVPGLGIPFFSPIEDCKLDRNYNFVDLDPKSPFENAHG